MCSLHGGGARGTGPIARALDLPAPLSFGQPSVSSASELHVWRGPTKTKPRTRAAETAACASLFRREFCFFLLFFRSAVTTLVTAHAAVVLEKRDAIASVARHGEHEGHRARRQPEDGRVPRRRRQGLVLVHGRALPLPVVRCARLVVLAVFEQACARAPTGARLSRRPRPVGSGSAFSGPPAAAQEFSNQLMR